MKRATQSGAGASHAPHCEYRSLSTDNRLSRASVNIASILALWLLVLAHCELCPISVAAASERPKRTARTLRVPKWGNPLLLCVTIGAEPYRFLLDTGSARTCLDESLRHLLGGATRTEWIYTTIDNDPIEVQLFKAPALALGGSRIRGVSEMHCLDFNEKGLVVDGAALNGLLGMDALNDSIAQIDFDRGELSLLTSVPDDAGEMFPMGFVRGVPSVAVQAGGAFVEYRDVPRFQLDTGDLSPHSGTLSAALFETLGRCEQLYSFSESKRATIIAAKTTRDARLTTLFLGSFEQRSLIFAEGSQNSLSLDFLSRYRVVFDFPGKRLFLTPTSRHAERDRRNLSGLSWRVIDGNVIITRVRESSPASAAGLRAGDVILQVDRHRANRLSALDFRRIITTPSTRLITVRRGMEKLHMPLFLPADSGVPLRPRAYTLAPNGRMIPAEDR